jgi:hypothetical protein
MHCNLYVLKPKGCVVDTIPIYNDLDILTNGMIDYIGEDITERELEHAVGIYDIATNKEKARERLEEIKGYIKKHLENDEVDTYTLNEACGAIVAIISDVGYEGAFRESELAIEVLENRLPHITDMEIAVFDYHQ